MNIFNLDMEPLSQYSPVMLHLSPATRSLNEKIEAITAKSQTEASMYWLSDSEVNTSKLRSEISL